MKGVVFSTASAIALIVATGVAPWAAGTAFAAQAMTSGAGPLSYGNADANDDAATAPDGSDTGAPRGRGGYGANGGGGQGGERKPRKRTKITPYIEIDQSVYDQIEPHRPAVTYTTLAAGADMTINSHRTTGVATIRYEHHFSESHSARSTDTITGIARTTTDLIPRTLTFDFGGLATHTSIAAGGATLPNPVDRTGSIYQIWSLYGGPSLSTHAGVLGIKANYALGYNAIDQIRSYVPAGSATPVDVFGHSLTNQATASIGVKPREVLPFGVALTGGYLREDTSNLDQRLTDERLGLQVTQPISHNAALVGDVGWEKVQVAHRNAQIGSDGNPVVSPNGQYVIDRTQPRRIAYQTSGLTWDVGVVWRPSRRTMGAVFVGKRYDSTTYYGNFYHAPNSRSNLTVSVFDGIYGFGSGLMSTIQALPNDFSVTRDPFNGNVGGCFIGSTGGGCLTGALGSANALAFRAHGGNATYGMTVGRLSANIGGGYFSRRFIGAQGTILASRNGALDQTWYVNAGLSGPIDRQTRFFVNGFASVYRNNTTSLGDTANWGATGSLVHHLTDRLTGTASVEVLGVNPTVSPDLLEMNGQLGLRYNFR
ncbi:hypothetical protein [Novosphingobium sp.]|uniref:hypothetical protein n=1 Tax=Novosphingobium sp. TaxID=1874826 RepID=UPI00333FFAB7